MLAKLDGHNSLTTNKKIIYRKTDVITADYFTNVNGGCNQT